MPALNMPQQKGPATCTLSQPRWEMQHPFVRLSPQNCMRNRSTLATERRRGRKHLAPEVLASAECMSPWSTLSLFSGQAAGTPLRRPLKHRLRIAESAYA